MNTNLALVVLSVAVCTNYHLVWPNLGEGPGYTPAIHVEPSLQPYVLTNYTLGFIEGTNRIPLVCIQYKTNGTMNIEAGNWTPRTKPPEQ